MSLVLVTGASGFIGRHLVAALLAEGLHVRTLHRGAALEDVPDHVQADVATAPLFGALAGVDQVVHLAALGDVAGSAADPVGYNLVNSVGTLRVLDASRARGAAVVLASTQHVYRPSSSRVSERTTPNPPNAYGLTKLVAERWCEMYSRNHGVPSTVLRFFSVYGPGQLPQGSSGVVAIFTGRALAGETIEVLSNQRRDFTHVSDVIQGIMATLRRLAPGYAIYNIATGRGTGLGRLARMIRRHTGSQSRVDTTRLTPAAGHLVPSVDLAAWELGFVPRVKLEDGIRSYCDWARLATVRSA